MVDSALAVPPLPQSKQPRNPISRKQVEKVISRSVAVFGLVFGAQTVPWLLSQIGEAEPLWLAVVVPALFGTLLIALVLSIAQVWVRQIQGTFAVIYLLALISWPFFVLPGVEVANAIHWLNYLMSVAIAMATIAFPTTITTIYLFLCPAIYIVVRIEPVGGSASWQLAVLEGVYALILSSAIVIIVTMLRQASTAVDSAQAMALDRYSHAVRQHATEVERVQVDSIVHDSVLTTFISAARAFTPQAQALAAAMAGNAIGHLRDAAAASPDDGTMVRFTSLAERITDAAAALSSPFELRIRSVGTRSLPVQASEAIYSAAVQAMVNSLQHAGEDGVSRWVSARSVSPGGIEIVVGDTGAGFDMSQRSDRLGVRVSILERISNAGGRATIQSAPGEGTVVTIRWPHTSAQQTPVFEQS
jgi:two-component sensor histidine kinase